VTGYCAVCWALVPAHEPTVHAADQPTAPVAGPHDRPATGGGPCTGTGKPVRAAR
jgi:hypothetical protein